MPVVDFGEKIPAIDGSSSKIFRLKREGEKVTIRIIDRPHYISRHFLEKDSGGWNIFFCPRVMKGSKCIYCEKYFDLMKQVKEAKNSGDKKAAEALAKEAKRYKETTRFYYPALIREREEAVLLEVPLSVRLKIDAYVEAGIDILGSDFVYTRTEKPGSDYYTLIRLDSRDTKPLTEKEKEEADSVKEWDIDKMLGFSKESSQELGTEENKTGEPVEQNDEGLYEKAKEIFGNGQEKKAGSK